MVELIRTYPVLLQPSAQIRNDLAKTVEVYTACFNAVAAYGYALQDANTYHLHEATYATMRKAYPGLGSQLTISARMKACEALASLFAQPHKPSQKHKKNKKTESCPHSERQAVRYDARSCTIHLDKGFFDIKIITKNTKKRARFPFTLPQGLEHYRQWKTAGGELRTDRQGRWWFDIHFKTLVEFPEPSEESTEKPAKKPTVIGVDLGLTVPAMDSQGQRYGNANWRIVEERYADHNARLQAKGTKSAKRRLKKSSGRQKRFRRDCDHVLSKRLIQGLGAGDVIVMENLTGIRDRVKMRKEQATRVHQWSFAQIKAFVGYKAEARGVQLALIDPKYTSQTCNQCGHRDRKNRKRQADFRCQSCGHCANADHNAACNIRDSFLGLPVNQPFVASPRGSPSRT